MKLLRRGRQARKPRAVDAVHEEFVRSAAKAAMRREYSLGFRDGTVSALRHLLDDPRAEAPDGAFKGELLEEVETWARDALARAEGS